MTWETVIGIEVHVELNTKTKMFCRCSADYFGQKPNTHTCPVCLGLPGAIPYINEEAIKKCLKIGLALNCTVNDQSYFERKNYFYPDLAKGYQISQLVKPLNINGSLTLDSRKVIRINRAHQEEDTAKLTHLPAGRQGQDSETLIDFNRSGVPLVEIVTEPDFETSDEVREYAQKLQQIFRHLGVSNADMEKGDMRLEANVSVRPAGQKELAPYRVELKNINSFRFMVAAIEYEVKRQIEALERGEKLTQETRGWNENKKETYLQRSKEEAHDYRYFPEPDIPPIRWTEDQINKLRSEIKGKLPTEKVESLAGTYKITLDSAATLINQGTAPLFSGTMEIGQPQSIDAQGTANYIINKKPDPSTTPQQIIDYMMSKTANIISDDTQLEKLVKEVIEENPKVLVDFKAGKENALQVLTGAVMKKSSAKANARKVKEILISHLK